MIFPAVWFPFLVVCFVDCWSCRILKPCRPKFGAGEKTIHRNNCRFNCLKWNSCIKQLNTADSAFRNLADLRVMTSTETVRMPRHPSKPEYRESKRIIVLGSFFLLQQQQKIKTAEPTSRSHTPKALKLHTRYLIFLFFHYFTKCNNICLSRCNTNVKLAKWCSLNKDSQKLPLFLPRPTNGSVV